MSIEIINIKNHSYFEKQLLRKVDELTQRCGEKKTELEKNIQNIAIRRQEVVIAVQKLQSEVSEAYRKKASRLKENERILQDEIKSLQREFDKDLDALKAQDRQRIKGITSTASLVANGRLGRREKDSLAAHTLLCEELDGLLKENVDKTSAAGISQTAQIKKFVPADDCLLELGEIEASNRCMRIVKEVDLPCSTYGIAKKSDDSVAVALQSCKCVDIVYCTGSRETLIKLPPGSYFDIAIESNGTMVTSHDSSTEINIHHAAEGTRMTTMNIQSSGTGYCPRISVGPSNEVVIVNWRQRSIYL